MTNIQNRDETIPLLPPKVSFTLSCWKLLVLSDLDAFLLGKCREIRFAVLLQHVSQHDGFQTHS